MTVLVACLGCGQEFEPQHPNRRTCSDACAKERRYALRRDGRGYEYTKRAREKNPEAHRAESRRYRSVHPDRVELLRKKPQHVVAARERAKRWRQENPERYRALQRLASSRRRARLRDVRADLTAVQWEAICIEFGGRCVYCGGPNEEMEHDVPVALGGEHTRSNVVPSCRRCNVDKGARTGKEWVLCRMLSDFNG